jgi:amino acid transporter
MSGAAQRAGSISGEIRNVNHSIPIALLFSNLFAFIIWSLSALTEINATGYQWLVALSYVWDNVPAKFLLPLPPSMHLMLGIVTYPKQMLTLVALGSFILANIAFVYILLVTVSRYFAWSFDRLIPTKFADVNARFKTPHYALIATFVIAAITALLFQYMGFSNFFAASSTLMVLCYAVLSCTVVIFPFTKWKTLLDQLPAFMRKKIAGVPSISIVAAITSIILFYAAYAVAINPLLSSNAQVTAELFGSIFVLGIVLYYVSKWYNNRQGIDITLIFKEIPPS